MKVKVKVNFVLPYVHKQHVIEKYIYFDPVEVDNGSRIWVNI